MTGNWQLNAELWKDSLADIPMQDKPGDVVRLEICASKHVSYDAARLT